ncbi:MAG: DUF4062 domain-containing protein [Lachnospiraceae bacterium]|nr:DUF4062 domain-containing protein [Lachnospiraceae bacterium]
MDKKTVVFLSSTYYDLQKERPATIKSIIKNHYIFSGMETFFVLPPLEQWKNIKRTISECDIYVTILGDRYGSTSHDDYSFTELECEYAAEIGKPIVALVQRKHRTWGGYWKKQSETHRQKQQALQDNIVCTHKYYWDDTEDLIHSMFDGILKIENSFNLVGLGKPLLNMDISDKNEPIIHAHFEYSDNTTLWNKQLYYYEYTYHYEDNELNESIKKIMQDTGMEAHSAIYCIVKHALLKEFTGKDIIINGLYIDDADVIYALNRISAINK